MKQEILQIEEALVKIELEKKHVHQREYTLVKIIGKGTYSTVYLTEFTDDIEEPEVQGSPKEGVKESKNTSEVVSELSEILQYSQKVHQQTSSAKSSKKYALKIIQRPNFNKCDQLYIDQK